MAAARARAWNGGLAITALCAVQFVDVLGVTVVVTALPRMLADLRAPASSGSLVSGGYAMSFGGLLMLGARLGDRFGHRRTITASLAVFALGALLGAVAGSVVLLTAARCLQGAAAAASVPSALRLLTTVTGEGSQRRRAIAAWSAAGASAGASGFVIGGVITDLASWRLVFWACLPMAAALAAAVLRSVPRDHGPALAGSLNAAAAAAFTAAVIAVADTALTMAAAHGWAVSACVTVAGAGLGLSSVASTTLGTTVAYTSRGTASGIINTAAQLGTATGIAVVLLIAAATTGLPGPSTSAPIIGWAAAAAIAAAGALAFTASPQPESATTRAAGGR